MTKETDYSVNEKYLSKLNLLKLVLTYHRTIRVC